MDEAEAVAAIGELVPLLERGLRPDTLVADDRVQLRPQHLVALDGLEAVDCGPAVEVKGAAGLDEQATHRLVEGHLRRRFDELAAVGVEAGQTGVGPAWGWLLDQSGGGKAANGVGH
jgi:hypothetical protein